MTEPLENLYFSWLCAKVSQVENPAPSSTHLKLFRKLFQTEFVWLLSGDDNRAEDGLELREEFFVASGITDEFDPHEGCSVFEMLIAFSHRAEFMVGETPRFWFWLMLENIGLSGANDASYNEEKAHRILYNFLWRLYDENGRGSLFPLTDSTQNQKETEIWYQFCEWLEDTDWPI